MGSHGHGGVKRFVLGSVADEVARHAPVPVMVVRGGSASPPAVQLTRIVVPLDGSDLAEQAIPVAATLAADLGVPVHLMRVLDIDALRATVQAGIHAAAASLRSQEEIQHYAEEYLAEQAQQLRNRDLAATTEVLTGSPAVTLLDAIRPDDLVVMTTHGRGGVRRMAPRQRRRQARPSRGRSRAARAGQRPGTRGPGGGVPRICRSVHMTRSAVPIGKHGGEPIAAGQAPVEAAHEVMPTVAQLFDLSGRVALVTGAGSGLGASLPRRWPRPGLGRLRWAAA